MFVLLESWKNLNVNINLQAGKLARNDFCRQFRLVVGEQLLHSAIPEMRGSEQGST